MYHTSVCFPVFGTQLYLPNIPVVVMSDLLLSVGVMVPLKLLETLDFVALLKLSSLQDLQHIWRYPMMEQYRLSASIRQNAERSPRHGCPTDRTVGRCES